MVLPVARVHPSTPVPALEEMAERVASDAAPQVWLARRVPASPAAAEVDPGEPVAVRMAMVRTEWPVAREVLAPAAALAGLWALWSPRFINPQTGMAGPTEPLVAVEVEGAVQAVIPQSAVRWLAAAVVREERAAARDKQAAAVKAAVVPSGFSWWTALRFT